MQHTTYYKIGISRSDVHKRAAELQTGNPFPLIPLLEKSVKDVRLAEQIVHDKYWLHRGLGEWFDFDPDSENHPVDFRDVVNYIKLTLDEDIERRLGFINDLLSCPYCGNACPNETVLARITKLGYCSRCNPKNKTFIGLSKYISQEEQKKDLEHGTT